MATLGKRLESIKVALYSFLSMTYFQISSESIFAKCAGSTNPSSVGVKVMLRVEETIISDLRAINLVDKWLR